MTSQTSNQYRSTFNELLTRYRTAVQRVRQGKADLEAAKSEVRNIEEAQQVLQKIAQAVQQSAHNKIAKVVTKCVQAVFGDAYEFKIIFERKRGKTEARLTFTRGENEVDPFSAASGGAVDVAAFALRLACLVLSKPRSRKVLVMDEPMKFVNGEEYQLRVAKMIEEMAELTGFQFIIVTDDDWLKIGKVVEL